MSDDPKPHNKFEKRAENLRKNLLRRKEQARKQNEKDNVDKQGGEE